MALIHQVICAGGFPSAEKVKKSETSQRNSFVKSKWSAGVNPDILRVVSHRIILKANHIHTCVNALLLIYNYFLPLSMINGWSATKVMS